MNAPEISVVMGVYNNADTLPAALGSILSQEGVELEFIAVDDGSTDGSAAILDEAAKNDPRLKVVHKRNEGLTRALIDGCALAVAPWIARQDADDVSLPGRLEKQLARARQSDAPCLVVCGASCRSPEGETLYEVVPPPDAGQARQKILDQGKTLCPHGAVLMRAESYRQAGGYRAPFHYAQDLDLATRLAEQGGIAAVPEVLYAFGFSPTSISGRHAARQAAFRQLLRECRKARMEGKSEQPALERALALSARVKALPAPAFGDFPGSYFIGCCLKKRNPRLARSYLSRALRIKPWSIPAVARWIEAMFREIGGGNR